MEPADAGYQSFIVRVWREDQTKTGAAAGGGWLFQLEDIASGDTCYFHKTSELADFVNKRLRTNTE